MDLAQYIPQGLEWWEIVLAVVAIILGWILSRLTRRAVLALLRRTPGIPETFAVVAARIAGYAVLLLGLGVALALLGANIQPLLAIVLIAAVVLVLVLRGVADNFAGGVLIQARQTVKLGDELQLEGPDGLVTGVVIELNSRSVLLRSVDGRTIHIPNARLLSEPIINNSTHGARRSEVQVRIERAGAAVDDVLVAMTGAAASVDEVRADPPPRALAQAVSTERVTVRLQFWHEPLDAVPVTSAVVRAVAQATERTGWRGTVTSEPVAPALTPSDDV